MERAGRGKFRNSDFYPIPAIDVQLRGSDFKASCRSTRANLELPPDERKMARAYEIKDDELLFIDSNFRRVTFYRITGLQDLKDEQDFFE